MHTRLDAWIRKQERATRALGYGEVLEPTKVQMSWRLLGRTGYDTRFLLTEWKAHLVWSASYPIRSDV